MVTPVITKPEPTACATIFPSESLRLVASIPERALPSPSNLVAVITPAEASIVTAVPTLITPSVIVTAEPTVILLGAVTFPIISPSTPSPPELLSIRFTFIVEI